MAYNSSYTGPEIDSAIGAVKNKEKTWDSKQDKLTGTAGQVVGFNASGNAQAQEAPDPLPSGGTEGQILTLGADGAEWADAPATGVTSFKGRTGAVTPQSGDYTAEMVGARPSTWTPTAQEVGAAKPGNVFTVTLTAAGWSSNSQTVSDERFAVSGYAYITNPADADFAKWAAAMIRGQDVTTAGQMAFTCEETPTENITVKILRVEAAEA